MITTTLNSIFACEGISEEYKRKYLEWTGKTQPDDEPITFASIVQKLGLSDAIFITRAEPQHAKVWMQFGLFCVRRIDRLIEQKSSDAITVGEKYISGDATKKCPEAALNAAIKVEHGDHETFSNADPDSPLNLDLTSWRPILANVLKWRAYVPAAEEEEAQKAEFLRLVS